MVALASLLIAPAAAKGAGLGSFTPTGSMGATRSYAAAAPLADGRVLIAGGFDDSNDLSSAEIFNPATGTFVSTGVAGMAMAREFAAAAPLRDGRVLVAGGFNVSALQSAEIFNPGTGSFSTATMTTKREGAVAALLPNGDVLVAGGFDGSSDLKTTEVYEPANGMFSPLNSSHDLGTPRQGAAAATLLDGRVLVAGGAHGSYLSSAEIYDPAAGSFSPTGSMTTPRAAAAAATLPDGRVLIAGGFDGSNDLSSAEIFNPATGTFSAAGVSAMSTARKGAAAAPLPDGRVLVMGGRREPVALSSAEIYGAANTFTFSVRGKSLVLNVQASGKATVSDAGAPLRATDAKRRRKKSRLLLSPSSASGDPPTISVPLSLTRLARGTLKKKGKVVIATRITFAPQGGVPGTQRATLTISGKKRKKK